MRGADLIVIGGGLIGLATAWRYLARRPADRVVVLEKERDVCTHQSGRNSGVVHTGLYYRPGSSKAAHCRRGRLALEAFCREHDVAFERCGKVVVATDASQLERLDELARRARSNGVRCEELDADGLRALEPAARGVRALHVPEAGIVDYPGVGRALARRLRAAGATIELGARVSGLATSASEVVIRSPSATWHAARVVNCAGLHSDRVLAATGRPRPVRIVPFRGEYFLLRAPARSLVRNLIYPVPDPALPFLGVHFTRRVDGSIECGPNAVLAFAREGYAKRDVDLGDLVDALGYVGFRRLAGRYWRTGLAEFGRSLSKRAFVRALRALVPAIEPRHLERAPAGVRAQAVDPSGALVDDFRIEHDGPIVHVLNAPSPAATSSLAIAETLVDALAPAEPPRHERPSS